LLDFGCGEGAFVASALEEKWDVKGYDLNVGGMEAANKHWKTNVFESGSFESYLAKNAESFDAVVALQVFEHLAEPLSLGKEVVKVLKPGGVFMIDVPNVRQLAERKKIGSTLDPTAHLCHFSTDSLSLLMEKLGCKVIYRSSAPSFYGLFRKLKLGKLAYSLGKLSKAVLPGIGTGVCVIGRKS
jgi:SAM-dependent methyltransferase